MQVPMLDLDAQYAPLHDEIMTEIEAVVRAHDFCNGQAVRDLEGILADYSGCAEAIGVASGTDALLAALMALDIGAGDEVITTPFTFFATAGVIHRCGARPVFVDIEPDTFNIDPARIEAAVTDKTKAILPVHLYGQMAEMDPIMDVAACHNLPVVTDAAQSVGATYRGRKACSIGAAGCLSFYPTKNLGAPGDAGMVLTNDPELADKIRSVRLHGQSDTYMHRLVGGNFRMDSMCAAGLKVKMKYLDGWTDTLRQHAARYDEILGGVSGVTTPTIRPHNESVYHQYVIRAEKRDELREALAEAQIGSGIYYPLGLHMQECFAYLGYKAGDMPESEKACEEVLALPIYPELSTEQVEYVAGTIREYCGA